MAAQLKTRTSEPRDSRVRVDVEVEPAALDRALEKTASALGRELKVPGFRKGKVPSAVVLRRLGREAVLDEAVRRSLPGWYDEAIADARIAPVGEPHVDLAELPERGSSLAFSIEVAVRPKAQLGNYRGLEVGRAKVEVAAEEIDAELERLRESSAALESVEHAAREGDFLVLDFVGMIDGKPFQGGEARGYLLELGSNRLVEGFEEQLVGASPGEARQVRVTFSQEYRSEELAGRAAEFEVTVREVKEKRLPELDDEFAAEAGGFDTLSELRADIEERIREAKERALDAEFREAAVDAAVAEASIEVDHELVHAKAHDMWHQTARRLRAQGLDPARYLEMTGKSEEQLVTDAEPEAERALKRESLLAAVVEADGIEVSDDDLVDSLRQAAQEGDGQPNERELRRSLERAKADGRDELLREDIAMRRAVDLIVESAKPIPLDQAKARDKLWTPDKEEREGERAGELWTPR